MDATHPSPAPVENPPRSGRLGEVTQMREVTLDTWTACAWTHRGLQIEGLEPLQVLRVRTRNNTYDVAVASSRPGDVFVRGGRYFPEWTRVQLAGASLGGACLKRHGIYLGFCLEFCWDGRRVVTSRVSAIVREATPLCELASLANN